MLWLELLTESGHLPVGKMDGLLSEAKTILAILGKAEKTARAKLGKKTAPNS